MAYESDFDLDEFELYNTARRLRKKTYQLINQLPKEERYCLGSQMRRAAASVTNNIAEGHGRWHYLENIQFCRVARGSAEEVIDDINACLDEGYGDSEYNKELRSTGFELVKRINGYIVYLQRSKQGLVKSGEG